MPISSVFASVTTPCALVGSRSSRWITFCSNARCTTEEPSKHSLTTGMWPPLLSAIPQSPSLWAEMVTFIAHRKRLHFCRNQATRYTNCWSTPYISPVSPSVFSSRILSHLCPFIFFLISSLHVSASQIKRRLALHSALGHTGGCLLEAALKV